MTVIARDELVILRHAPADHGGRLCGRTDVPALLPDSAVLQPLRDRLSGLPVVTSPARRCRETTGALFPGAAMQEDARLWEQDFGAHEGMAFAELPDLGQLTGEGLAQHRAPDGESYLQMVERAEPALRGFFLKVHEAGPVVVVAHAGTARAALGLALGQAALGLAFEIAPLSLTRLRCHANGVSVIATNERVGGC